MEITVGVGVGRGPTELSAYDAALAGAGVHNYNLVRVSSVVPREADVATVGTVPDLGPAGHRLTVVEAHATAEPTTGSVGDGVTAEVVNEAETPSDDEGTVVAGLGWATGPGPGLFYEATGTDSSTVRDRLERGLDAGADLREWSLPERDVELVAAEAELDAHVGVVAVAAYGTAERIGGPPVRTGESETRQI